jgi:hypothetical protein
VCNLGRKIIREAEFLLEFLSIFIKPYNPNKKIMPRGALAKSLLSGSNWNFVKGSLSDLILSPLTYIPFQKIFNLKTLKALGHF